MTAALDFIIPLSLCPGILLGLTCLPDPVPALLEVGSLCKLTKYSFCKVSKVSFNVLQILLSSPEKHFSLSVTSHPRQ